MHGFIAEDVLRNAANAHSLSFQRTENDGLEPHHVVAAVL